MSTAIDFSHGLPTAVLTVAIAKGYTFATGNDNVSMMTQLEAGAINGVSAVLADTVLPKQSLTVRAGATGVVTAGAMYLYHGDQLWWFWIPLGAGSYLVGDWAMKQYATMSAKASASQGMENARADVLGEGGAGQQRMPSMAGY